MALPPIKQIQEKELDILKDVTAYLEERGYHYVIMGGTLLGAVRHQGFIPWDDDIDIALPRSEYDRFCLEAKDVYNEGYLRFCHHCIDPGYLYYFARVIDTRYTFKNTSAALEAEAHPWIDIFPLDGVPAGHKGKRHLRCILKRRLFFQYARMKELVNVHTKGRPWYERMAIGLGKLPFIRALFKKERTYARLDELLHRYDYESCPLAINAMGAGKLKECQPTSLYSKRAKYRFEDIEVYGVEDADTWLTKMYGDYKTLPPLDERNKHCSELE